MAQDPLKNLKEMGLNVQDDECKKIVCMDQNDALKKYQRKVQRNADSKQNNLQKQQCPLTRERLGRYSWSILHTFAAYYPSQPTNEEKQSAVGFLSGFKSLYPCTHCKAHFSKSFQKDPPTVNSQKQLSLWVCKQHNIVNKLLGKVQFQCSIQNLNKRWMTGCQDEQKGF